MDQKQIDLIRRIASVVGHELRNPLAVINNSAYFLKAKLGGDGRLDPKVERHLGIVTSEIARIDRMLSDILAYPRPLEAKAGPLALGTIVESALAALAVPDSIKISKKLPKAPVHAVGDEKLVVESLRRLLDNAVEALPSGGTVTVTAGREAAWAFIEVADTGEGVKPEVLPFLFQPFSTGKPRGLGLGLAMAQKAFLAQKGKVEGGNAAGGGARFRLLLPAGA